MGRRHQQKGKKPRENLLPYAQLHRHARRQGLRRISQTKEMEKILRADLESHLGSILHTALALTTSGGRSRINVRDITHAAYMTKGVRVQPRHELAAQRRALLARRAAARRRAGAEGDKADA